MKKLLLGLTLLTSMSTYATQMCGDGAIISAMAMEKVVLKCDDTLPVDVFHKLERSLQSKFRYKTKVINSMTDINEYMNYELEFHLAQSDEVKECVKKLKYNDAYKNLKTSVMDALVSCGGYFPISF